MNTWTNLLKERLFGPPLPPPDKIEKVIGVRDVHLFLNSGRETAAIIRDALRRQGTTLLQASPVLDFGCGVGRVLRHFRKDGVELHGTDYNPELIAWCRDNLRFAGFEVNPLEGPLSYRSGYFGFIYAFSVFTHLTAAQGLYWMSELGRVLRPGGLLFFTTSGEDYLAHYWQLYKRYLEGSRQHALLRELIETHSLGRLEQHTPLSEQQTERFRNGELVVLSEDNAGKNECAAFHPASYVKGTLSRSFEVVEHLPGGAGGSSHHDGWILRKPF